MTPDEKSTAVDKGFKKFGSYDFFMVDSRTIEVKAAPFHINDEDDKKFFAKEASPTIDWVASLSANS